MHIGHGEEDLRTRRKKDLLQVLTQVTLSPLPPLLPAPALTLLLDSQVNPKLLQLDQKYL